MRDLSENIINMGKQAGIIFPMCLPLYDNPPNSEYLTQWASSQATPMLRQIAATIVAKLRYISFDTFLSKLQQTVNDFNQQIKDRPYVLLVAEHRKYKLENGCSDQWVSGLALEYCKLKEPTAILTLAEFPDYLKSNEVDHILLLDDAAYSGTQKVDAMTYLVTQDVWQHTIDREHAEKIKKISCYIGIPFVTRYAVERFYQEQYKFYNVVFLAHEIIPVMPDILSEKEWLYANKIDTHYISNCHALIYFDHKFPDFYSAFQSIYTGFSLCAVEDKLMHFYGYTCQETVARPPYITQIKTAQEWNNLFLKWISPNFGADRHGYTIPTIIPPYQLHRYDIRQELKQAIEANKVGRRNLNIAHHADVQSLVMSTKPCATQAIIYRKPELPLDVQIEFDKAVFHDRWLITTYSEEKELIKKTSLVTDAITQQPKSSRIITEEKYQLLQQQINELYMEIDKLGELGITLQKSNKTVGDATVKHAGELQQYAHCFFRYNYQLVAKGFPTFKKDFIEKLHAKDNIVNTAAKQIIANILIILTGIGLALFLAKQAHSLYTTGQGSLFFSAELKKAEKINAVETSLRNIAF